MVNSDFVNALIGGICIGLAASGMMWANGRVMGVSGILGGLFKPKDKDVVWRILFIGGILTGSFLIPQLGFSVMEVPFDRGIASALIGGLFVGVGTTIGNGCTSGHGVCGISRFSPRSIVATIIFMVLGITTVGALNSLFGGLS